MLALRELLLHVRLLNATLCAAACRAAIARERVALDRAVRVQDEARAAMRILEHRDHAEPPPYLLRSKV